MFSQVVDWKSENCFILDVLPCLVLFSSIVMTTPIGLYCTAAIDPTSILPHEKVMCAFFFFWVTCC
jgi:hypothetical protein